MMQCLTEECRRRHCCARKEDCKSEPLESVRVEEVKKNGRAKKANEEGDSVKSCRSEENLERSKENVDVNL